MKQRMHTSARAPRWAAALALAGLSVSMLSAMAEEVHTYTVTDGETVKTVSLMTDDLERVRAQAGFGGDEYEVVGMRHKNEMMTEVRVEEKFPITIRTAEGMTVLEVTSGTVARQLQRAGVAFDSDDKVSPALTERVTGETDITLVRVDTQTEVVTEPIAFATEQRYNDQMAYGTTRVVQDGVDGERRLTYSVAYEDGAEVSRTLTADEVVTEATPQIVELGTAGAVTTRSGEILRYSKVVEVTATAYSGEEASGKRTAMGTKCRVGAVAVDPRVIPLGSRLYIEAADGESWVYGTAVAEDTGGAIKGNRVDLFYDTSAECYRFGRRAAKIYILS